MINSYCAVNDWTGVPTTGTLVSGRQKDTGSLQNPPGSIRIWAAHARPPELTAVTCRHPGLSSTPHIDRPPGPRPKSDHAQLPPVSTGGLGLVPGRAGASEVRTENGPFSKTGQCPAACRGEQTDSVQPSWSSGVKSKRPGKEPKDIVLGRPGQKQIHK